MLYDTTVSSKEKSIITKFMKERALPGWFRGLSKFQIEAADSLQSCIQDDCEQATSHRVRNAVRNIGIHPLVAPSKIKFVMELSRGNDIAFLWFLMELYYRSAGEEKGHKNYSVNEQIFFTVIARLDTIPTFKELDKLLPKQTEVFKTKKILTKKTIKSNVVSPYFEKQRRPLLFGKSLIHKEIDNIANLSEYGKNLNPNYESNRWFANYKMRKSERIAKGILKDLIGAITDTENDKPHVNQKDTIVCAHHQNERLMKESIENEFKVARKKACQKFFDIEGHFRNQSCKRVISKLNKEIAKASENSKKLADKSFRKEQNIFGGPDGKTQDVSNKIHDENINLYNFGEDAVLNGICKYFKAPTGNKPYKFNYNRIFDFGARNPIKDAIASALKADSSENMSVEHSRAIKKCCKEMWTQKVKNYNASYEKEKNSKEKERLQSESQELQFDQSYFDPSNKERLQSMLLQALQEMKKNKKFVLASLPDAHKFPVLREWMRNRYGLVYKRQDKRKNFKRTKIVYQVLRNNALRVRIPRLDDLSRKRIVSYGCKEYLQKKTNYLKEKYHHNFKESLLDDARIYWAAVRPYQCTKGPPRDTFFAYLPASKNDVHLFRPWKSREYMHAKDEWDKRQRQKRIKCSY